MKGPKEPQQKEAEDLTLTNRQGHPIYDNQNNRTVGDRGPTVLENYNFLEKISHFDRERRKSASRLQTLLFLVANCAAYLAL